MAVVLVGNDPASEVYVRNKGIQTKEVGMTSYEFKLPEDTPEKELLEKVEELNNDPNINGILVQFPVPQQISQQKAPTPFTSTIVMFDAFSASFAAINTYPAGSVSSMNMLIPD